MKAIKKFYIIMTLILTVVAGTVFGNGKTQSGGASNGGVEKLVLAMYSEEATGRTMVNEWVVDFERNNPAIKIEIQQVSSSDYMTVFKTRFLAGDAPDIFINKPRSFEEFWKAGYILDLTNYPWIHNIDEAVIEEATVDGHYIGIGCVARPQGLIYNIDMFEKNGLKPPATYSEFLQVCDYFVSKGINPLMHAFAYSSAAYVEHSCWANNMAINAGEGDLYRKVQKGEATLSGSKWFTQSMVIFADHLKYMDRGDLSVDASTAQERFAVGERPMFTYMGHVYGELKMLNPKGRFGIVPYPWSDNPKDNLLSITLDQGASINAHSKYINASLKFLEYLCSPSAGNIMTKNLKIPSPVKGSDASLLGSDEYIDTMNEAQRNGVAPKYMVPEMTGEYRDTFRGLLSEFTALSPEKRNPAEFVKLMDKRLSEIK